MIDYDLYRPTSTLNWTKDGKTITRVVYVRAADEIEAHQLPDVPKRGDVLDLSEDSGTNEFLYADTVDYDQLEPIAGDIGGDFMFEVTAVFNPLDGNNPVPVVDKATWRVSFRPQQITLKNVDEDADQEHFGPGSGGEDWWPITTGINENTEGPQGVQIDEMVEVLSIDFWKNPDDVIDFLSAVRTIGNGVNLAAFDGPWGNYPAEEIRITGLEVNQQSAEIVTVSVEFSRSENRDNIQVKLDNADATVSVDKKGWQYLWVRWVKSSDPESEDEEPKPRRIDAHVATVYKPKDFDPLGVTDEIFV